MPYYQQTQSFLKRECDFGGECDTTLHVLQFHIIQQKCPVGFLPFFCNSCAFLVRYSNH